MNINLVNRGVFILCILFSSCAVSAKTPEYVKIATKVRNEVAKKIAKKYHMHFFATSGALMHNVKGLGASFQIRRILSKEEARSLVVDCVNIFLDEINNNEEIRPYLVGYPFQPENVEIDIYIYDENRRNLYDPLISVVSSYKGKIIYATNSPNKVDYENVYRETYEEALAILGKNGVVAKFTTESRKSQKITGWARGRMGVFVATHCFAASNNDFNLLLY